MQRRAIGHTIKWVPKDLEHVVIAAYEKLIEIGRPAREAAKYVFDSGNKFYRHKECITPQGFPEDGMLSTLEFAHAMCFGEKTIGDIRNASKDESSDRAWSLVGAKSSQWVQRLLVHGKPTYKRLGEFVVDKYRTQYWPNFSENGQPVWNSLLLLRDQEFHGKFSPRLNSWRLPSVNELNAQISSRDKLKTPPETIFQRMGYANEDGTPIRLTSHQIRVWLSTNAERGGMDSWKLAQWAGRARVDDNRHYDLRTTEERLSNARAVIGHQEKPSVLDAIKSNLPVSYKDLGINRLGVADVTEYGMCTHDYAMSPCIKAGECMTCKEHVCIKGMPKTAERIESLAIMVGSQLEKARTDETNEVFGADRWVTHLGWKLAHLRAQLGLMKSEKTPKGAVLRMPPEHDPSPIKRALEHRDLGTTANERDIVELSTIEQLLGIENA
jgi:hypothetical protein